MKFFISFLIPFLIFSYNSSAEVIRVPDDYSTIQLAIDSCNSGDTILVAPGTYNESLITNEKSIVLASYFLTESDSNHITSTILKGTDGPVLSVNNGADSITVIGFTINGGNSEKGAGINATNTRLIVKDNIFSFNWNSKWPTGSGGAIYALSSELIIYNNRFEYNRSDNGGALYATGCELWIKDNTFNNNRVQKSGGALHFGSSTVFIERNTFFQNWASQSGGAIACGGSQGYIKDNDIIENIYTDLDSTGSENGGGILCSGRIHGTLKVINNVITKNRASNGGAIVCGNYVLVQNNLITKNDEGLGGAIYITGDSRIVNNTIYGNDGYSTIYIKSGSPEITNNIIWGNSLHDEMKTIHIEPAPGTPIISYCNIQDGFEGAGNFSLDPLFRNVVTGDFHLKSIDCGDDANSPCIDAGSPAYSDTLLHCGAGLGTILSDVGAYGGGKEITTVIEDKYVTFPTDPYIIKVAPNPFNTSAKISFVVEKAQNISVSIYNIMGKEIRKLYNGFVEKGEKSLLWSGIDDKGLNVASGIYIVNLSIGNRNYSQKTMLIK